MECGNETGEIVNFFEINEFYEGNLKQIPNESKIIEDYLKVAWHFLFPGIIDVFYESYNNVIFIALLLIFHLYTHKF